MKKILLLILTIVMVASAICLTSYAEGDIKIIINDEEKTFDVMPQIVDGRTLVPMRGIFEAFEAKVKWIASTKAVYAEKNDTRITLPVGETIVKVNGETKELDVPAQIVDGRTLVPVRFIAETLGCKVEWNADTNTVIINEIKETVIDALLPEGGEVLVYPKDLLATASGAKTVQDNVYTVNVSSKGDKDTSVETVLKVSLAGKILKDDVCMLTFKARLVSGGENGTGYIKPYVQSSQNTKWKKALFARTEFSNEWTNCYMPFVGIDDMCDMGIRFGAMAQKIEIKDFQLINYGTSVKLEDLPSTILSEQVWDSPENKTPDVQITVPDSEIVADEKIDDPSLPNGGKVITGMSEFVNNSNSIPNAYGTIEKTPELIIFNITSVPQNQSDSVWRLKNPLDLGSFNAGDTMLITFKARLISGGKDGRGYVKAQLEETTTFKKSIFATTSFGAEWTTCYMPFEQIDGAIYFGLRVAPVAQTFELKDIQIINYDTSVKIDALPSTICDDPK